MKKKVLIIVENSPVPFDPRVWKEACSLQQNGYDVTVLCPRDKGCERGYEFLEGVHVYRHPRTEDGNSPLGYLLEYSNALFWEFFYSWYIYFRHGFNVIQGCNPPDTIFLVALPFKLLGVKYIFDHHDINPELYFSKYGKQEFLYEVLVGLEKLTFRFSDVAMATNALKYNKPYLVGYVGTMSIQEGLDTLLDAAVHIRNLGRNDVHFTCVGGGPGLASLQKMVQDKHLEDIVNFTGRIPDEQLLDILSTADVCVNPDKPCEMNDLSTMIKIMEYMALGKPIVQPMAAR